MNHRGQVHSIDLIAGMFVFLVIVAFMLQFWSLGIKNAEAMVKRSKMGATAVSVSDILLKGAGVPWDWNSSNVNSIGLASSQNVLSASRISNFTNLPYNDSKALLGVDYEFHFYVEDLSGNRLYSLGNSSTGGQSVSITRFALLNGEKVRLRLTIHD